MGRVAAALLAAGVPSLVQVAWVRRLGTWPRGARRFPAFTSPGSLQGIPGHRGAGPIARMATAAAAGDLSGMTCQDRFFFDLNGFLLVRNALSADEVEALNAAVDAHADEIKERKDPELRNTKAGTPLSGDGTSGRRDLGGMLGWPLPHREPFRRLLAHPRLVPYLTELCGDGYRLDHSPLIIAQHRNSEGFRLHGGPLSGSGEFNPSLQYRCVGGKFFNSLLAMSVQLCDHGPGDGGFCVVRGSHKMNFPVPEEFADGKAAREHLHQPVTKAGDVVFFSEATVHGAQPWNADHERRIVLYRFAPSTVAYGRAYAPSWPASVLAGLPPRERAVLEPPYANRLDRPVLKHGEEEPKVTSRSAKKRKFDEVVFGSTYF